LVVVGADSAAAGVILAEAVPQEVGR